ncbi:MAG: tetratricopeptide repeat protein [Coleofasciculaceae cyanobacterium SM2_1_6]|nr:tetratricopeptide repeat protein [Coleofasciculaceae cyanobacterium SM2_1_6]
MSDPKYPDKYQDNQERKKQETAIEALLRRSIGLEANSLGSQVITGAVEQRCRALGIADLATYYTNLLTNPSELEALVEALVVPETWFFRDREPFNYLGQYIKTAWLANPSRVLKILSAPCATGEEPYSIAITLLEAGLSPANFRIDALDISKVALTKARQALYSSNSFRGEDCSFRDRYFQPVGSSYQLEESIACTVNFQQGNLLDLNLDPNLAQQQGFYDVIFCRNVLIYFDLMARIKTIDHLHYLLQPKGLLFVGHSETGQISTSPKFTSIPHPLAFAYQKISPTSTSHLPSKPASLNPLFSSPAQITSKFIAKIPGDRPLLPPPTRPQNIITNSSAKLSYKSLEKPAKEPSKEPSKNILVNTLAMARDLGDRGQLDAAITACETYLQVNRTSAEAHYLLGELHQAQGQLEQAELNFERAIYLNPHLEEALVHLALIKEQQGDLNRAAIIWQRVKRLQ